MAIPAISSPRVFVSTVPIIIETSKTNTELKKYWVLTSEFVKPKDFIRAIEFLSFVISIFIKSRVISIDISDATAIETLEATFTELIIWPKVCSIYSSIPETFANGNSWAYSDTF